MTTHPSLLESLHGAPADFDGTGALGFRHAAFNVSVMAVWRDPALDEEHIHWARETAAALEPWSYSGGGYVNYMQADEPLERVRAAFGAESFDRLRALKRRYDPDNVFNQNYAIVVEPDAAFAYADFDALDEETRQGRLKAGAIRDFVQRMRRIAPDV